MKLPGVKINKSVSGRPISATISFKQHEEWLEDFLDVQFAKEAEKDTGTPIPWEEVDKTLVKHFRIGGLPKKKNEFEVIVLPKASKALKALHKPDVMRIRALILVLTENPFPNGYKKLQGFENTYRLRSGNYRIIYQIHKDSPIIEITNISDRKNAY